MHEIVGFRNLDREGGTIAKCLESQALEDHGRTDKPGLVALAVTGSSYTDEQISGVASALPEGQTLWAFSPTPRQVRNERARVQHVPATNTQEFVLKVARHLELFVKQQPAGSPLNPQAPPFPTIHRVYGSPAEYSPLLDELHTAQVDVAGTTLEFFADLRADSDHLLVFGQDALTRAKVTLPHFFRWKWTRDIEASVIILSDPTLRLDEELDAGWWVGTQDRDYVHDAVELVRTVSSSLSVPRERVVFFGASAGGFSALHMAAALLGASAVVDIPQVDLRTYAVRDAADAAVRAGLGFESVDAVPPEFLHRIDAVERFRNEGNVPLTMYYQNMKDETHVDAQMGHFRRRLRELDNSERVNFREYSQWHLTKGGHFPMNRTNTVAAINTLVTDLR